MGDAKFKRGQSGNPAGRPPGVLNKKTLVCKALDAASEDVTKAVIDAARGGDMQAARLVLERVKPPLRAKAEPVQFALDPSGPLTAQARQVLVAVAAGDVDPETGKLLLDCIHGLAAIQNVDELASRIEALEAQQREQGATARGNVVEQA